MQITTRATVLVVALLASAPLLAVGSGTSTGPSASDMMEHSASVTMPGLPH